MPNAETRTPRVGEDVAIPAGDANHGKIRIRSERAVEVARWFGLGRPPGRRAKKRRRQDSLAPVAMCLAPTPVAPATQLTLAPGTITLITGVSGAGKSSLLRELRARAVAERKWIDLAAIRVANVPVVNCFGDLPLLDTLALLGRVGLGEAWSYLRTPRELSDGQKFRLRLAIGLNRAAGRSQPSASAKPRFDEAHRGQFHEGHRGQAAIIACDEFAAVLDRLTAMIVARCLRRAIDAHPNVAGVVATSHDDLIAALAPDVIVRCDFGRTMVARGKNRAGDGPSLRWSLELR